MDRRANRSSLLKVLPLLALALPGTLHAASAQPSVLDAPVTPAQPGVATKKGTELPAGAGGANWGGQNIVPPEEQAKQMGLIKDPNPDPTPVATGPTAPPRASLVVTGSPDAQLVLAATAGTAEEIMTLVKEGADPRTAASGAGVPVLSIAVMRKDPDAKGAVTALLTSGADVNVLDGYGQTPLFYASKVGNVDMVIFLLEKGANYSQTDSNGISARAAAFQAGHTDVVKAMDTFAEKLNEETLKGYQERNKQLQQRGEQLLKREQGMNRAEARAQQLQQMQQQQQAQPESTTKLGPDGRPVLPPPPPIPGGGTMPEPETPLPPRGDKSTEAPLSKSSVSRKADLIDLEDLIYDLSYEACAVQYWEFCRVNRLETDYNRDELRDVVEAHQALMEEAASTITGNFQASRPYIDAIIGPSRERINKEIGRPYLTNAHRAADGIGTSDDMDERCAYIADQWRLVDRKGKTLKRRVTTKAMPAEEAPADDSADTEDADTSSATTESGTGAATGGAVHDPFSKTGGTASSVDDARARFLEKVKKEQAQEQLRKQKLIESLRNQRGGPKPTPRKTQ